MCLPMIGTGGGVRGVEKIDEDLVENGVEGRRGSLLFGLWLGCDAPHLPPGPRFFLGRSNSRHKSFEICTPPSAAPIFGGEVRGDKRQAMSPLMSGEGIACRSLAYTRT